MVEAKNCNNCEYRVGECHHWRTGWCECYHENCYFNEEDWKNQLEAQTIINGDSTFAEKCIHYKPVFNSKKTRNN